MTDHDGAHPVGDDRPSMPEVDPFESTSSATPPAHWDSPDLERIWLAAHSLEWRSLALVPASEGISVIELAHAISALGLSHRGESIGVADLRDVPLPRVRGHIEVVRWHVNHGERVILALRSTFENIATIPLVRVADRAILCVALGLTGIAQANQTVEHVGRDRFIGTVILRPTATVGVTERSRRLQA
jgi:hypothetical protein